MAGNVMPKFSEDVEIAATEYFQEIGEVEFDARWIAEFFQDCGVQDVPATGSLAFYELVQKALSKNTQSRGKQARIELKKSYVSSSTNLNPEPPAVLIA